jgi:hypothetical protein
MLPPQRATIVHTPPGVRLAHAPNFIYASASGNVTNG